MDDSAKRKRFWREQIRNHIIQAFGAKCQCCNKTYENCCFDLHHLDPSQKNFAISNIQFNGAKSWLKVRDEVKKCALVCANCHRLIHGGFIQAPIKSEFNNDYYDWEFTKYN